MTATITAAERILTQTHPQKTRLGLCIFRPTPIFTAEVTGTGDGSSNLVLTNVSITRNPHKHYTVVAGSSAGLSDGGKVRFKSYSAPVMKVSANNIEWTIYPHITVLEVIEPLSIYPDLGNDFMDEDVPYDGVSNLRYHPLSRIGPPAFGLTNQAVKFYAAPQAIASGASISSHSWEFPSGSPSTSSSQGSALSPIEVTWSAPTNHFPHYAKYTATDSNGRTHTRYTPVWIFDNFDDCFCDVELGSLETSWSSGFASMSITVFNAGDSTAWPQDAMIMLVAEDYYGATKQSIGGNWTHREDIVYVGYIVSDTIQINANLETVSFDTEGIMGMAARLLVWPANLEDDGSPDGWDRLSGMTTGRAAFHVLTERSTLDHIADINYDAGMTLQAVDMPETAVANQLNDYCLAANREQKAVSDFQGQIWMVDAINIMSTSERSSIPQTMEFEFVDIRDDPGLNIAVEENNPQVAQVDFIGFDYDGQEATPFYSIAPENQYEHGDIEKADGIRVDTQAEANEVSGLILADRNNIFREVSIPTFNFRIFDIAPEQYGLLSLSGSDNPRGLVWSSQKLIPRQISYAFDPEKQQFDVTITFEKDTFGPPGVPGYYPSAPPAVPTPKPPAYETVPSSLIVWDEVQGTYVRGSWRNANDTLPVADTYDLSGDIDPYWWTASKQGTFFSQKLIAYKTLPGKILKTYTGGSGWIDVTPSERYQTAFGNDWGLATPPTVYNMAWDDFQGSLATNDLFVTVGSYEYETDKWAAAMEVSETGVAPGSYSWLPKTLRPWWLASNLTYEDIAAAHQAIGRPSKTYSLENIADPGTDDATEGGTVTWTRGGGWDFRSASTWVASPVTTDVDGNLSAFVAFQNLGTTGWLFGISESGSEFGASVSGTTITVQKGSFSTTIEGETEGVIAIVRRESDDAIFFDGTQVASGAQQSLSNARDIFFGAANDGATATSYGELEIGSVAMVSGYPLDDAQIKAMSWQMKGLKGG